MACVDNKTDEEVTELVCSLGEKLNADLRKLAEENGLCPSCAYQVCLSGLFGTMALAGFSPPIINLRRTGPIQGSPDKNEAGRRDP